MQKNDPSSSIQRQHQRDLYQAILNIDSSKLLQSFLNDLLTPAEHQALTERWQVVKLLHQGMTQRDIAEKLHISVTTVTRVARCLQGKNSGYQQLLAKQA